MIKRLSITSKKFPLPKDDLNLIKISRGNSWFDLGTPNSILTASNFVQLLQDRQGLLLGSPEEAALNSQLITIEEIQGNNFSENVYLSKLIKLFENL